MALQQIYEKLELTNKGCLIQLSDTDWEKKVSLPSRVSRLLKTNDLLKTMDGFFCFDNKPLILFFDNPNKEQKEALHQAIWNFNESPVVILLENNVVEIFNGFAIDENTKLLKYLGGEDSLDDFSYFKLVTGKTWEEYNDRINHNTRVDNRLLDNIEEVQKQLKKEGLTQKVVNALLGKIIFFRYLIDRHVILNYQENATWTNEDLCNCLKDINNFKQFVKYIERKFNGDMFRIADEEFVKINQRALNILIRLLQSENLSTGQMSLFDLYDFSILPIEFISNIYEKFIGKEIQEKKGAYYTPTFLVDYIVSETVGKKLKESNTYNCRVLDPACGSGIFLVESLRRMIEKYILEKNITDTNTNEFKKTLNDLTVNNIFGIDEDFSAIQVAIFSIYLTLLDYQEPADIENFKFPNLLGTNLICSDTFDVGNKDLKAFEEKKYTFDFVIGNPPWKGAGGEKHAKDYLKRRKRKEKGNEIEIGVNNNELAEYFVFRASDFCSENTKIALIIHSTSLYNSKNGINTFRNYLLKYFCLHKVVELACVRKEVFDKSNDKAIAPACILFYKNAFGKNTDSNVVTHIAVKPSHFFSAFKILSICRNDIQEIKQSKLQQYDWLWKVLVFGSYQDFLLIKNLKKRNSIGQIISDDERFVHATGVTFSKNNAKYDASNYKEWKFINTKAIDCFFINPDKTGFFQEDRLGRIRNTQNNIFYAPMLLIRHGLPLDSLAVRSAISYENAIFKKSLLSIKANNSEDISVLKNIACFYASNVLKYLAILTFSSIGIERENAKEFELLSVPYVEFENDYYEILEQLYNECNVETKKLVCNDTYVSTIKKQIEDKLYSLNQETNRGLNLSERECACVDYALNVSRVIIRINAFENEANRLEYIHNCKLYKKIKKDDSILKDYVQVYINRFAESFSRVGKCFIVKIHYSSKIIGMFFNVVDGGTLSDNISIFDDCDMLSSAMIRLSSEKITDRLFVQKDIRGFEKDGFYIFKPNEARLWHKAIAYLDVDEFVDAILKTGGNGYE